VTAYEEMLGQLLGAARFGVRFGLERMRAALDALGAPDRALGRVALVGGTNGKGSTAAMLALMLTRHGLRAGLFTSPHLARFTERIRIDGREVDRAALAGRYRRMARVMPADLTFFEQATVLGMMTFAEEGTEAVVLEVGMGGRLDATNAAEPEVSVVTGVALDHQEVLGADLAAIAREKAGIFRAGRPAVIGSGGEPEAVPVLEAEARARGASVVRVGCDAPWPLALAGAHQLCNAACAIAAARALGLSAEAQRAGLAEVRWPGRLERIGDVVLDAAHNPQAAGALARALAGEEYVLVAGVSSDKDLAGVLRPLVAPARAVVLTQAPSARAAPVAALAAVAPEAEREPDFRAALARARALARGATVVVCGSIFLAGAVRALLTGEEVDPVTTADPAGRTGNLPPGSAGA
jgi:dihydrofolate synthase / folylpolyglutamate synthase